MANPYPVRLTPDGEGFLVQFPDIPEAITYGATREEALQLAKDALLTALEFYFEDLREVPKPAPVGLGEDFVELPPSIAVKVQLLNEMVHQRIKQVDLAKRMQVSPTQVNRMVNLRQATKIDTLNEAFKALGKRLEFFVA